MSENKLPADPLALILGIISLLVSVGGCCLSIAFFPFALLSIMPVIISIIGLVMAAKSLRLYKAQPEIYLKKSRDNVATAKVVNIITLAFGGLIFLSILIGFIYMGSGIYNFYDNIDKDDLLKKYPHLIDEEDRINKQGEGDGFEEFEKDTLMIDSTFIEEIRETEIIEN